MDRGNDGGAPIAGAVRAFGAVRGGTDWERWRALAQDGPPFLLPEFFALTIPLVEGEPLVATASRGDRLVGVLPLLLSGGKLHRLGSDHSPWFDYCGAPEGLPAIWRAVRRDRRWSELFLEGVPAASPLTTHLPALTRGDLCPARVIAYNRHRHFALPGFEERLDKRFRHELHRCERKAGTLELERIARPSRADFREAAAIESMAWKAAAGTDIASNARVMHLYAALGRLLGPRGRAHLYFLRAAGQRIVALLTVEDRHTLYALKIGHDPRHSALSPGHLMFWKVAADAERRGLQELNFVGRDAEYKRKWTDETHELVAVRVYQRALRGLASYALREHVKPRLPEAMRDLRTPLRRGCQRADVLGVHTLVERVRGRLDAGLGIRSGLKQLVARRPPPREPLGEPSRFAAGEWVRVLDAGQIRPTLDARSRLRGLQFIPQQWSTCGRVFRVQKQVRRMRDDRGRYRPIARTVLLDGATCAGDGPGPAGCGRHCPSMYRDEWLEPAPRPRPEPPGAPTRRHARIRGADEIAERLDVFGRQDGLTFMPEMAQHTGRRAAIVEAIPKVFEYDRWVETRRPIYVLEGLHCSGAVAGEPGPCDRACALLWHEDWLILEPGPRQDS